MRKAFVLLMLFGLHASVQAYPIAPSPVEELVPGSDFIVVGTLRGVTEYTADGVDYGEGRIDVSEVIWGGVASGDLLLLRWQNSSAIVCPRIEQKHNAHEEGIWLLTRDGEAVRANNPGRFVGLSERGKVEAALRNSPVVLRSESYWVKPGEPMRFSVVYRNTSNVPRAFPGLVFEGGSIHLSPGSRLSVSVTLCDGEAYVVPRMSGRVVRDTTLAPVTVPPRGEHRVALDLREMIVKEPAEKDSLTINLKFDGLPRTNVLDFYVSEPHSLRPSPPLPAPSVDPVSVVSIRFEPSDRAGLTPLTRAAIVALVALLLFPFFYKLRSALAGARLARIIRGT
jgi:hypothetical protein